jgi:hypothetical protein
VPRVLSSHPGPARRFSTPACYEKLRDRTTVTLDGWLRSRALTGLQELDFHYDVPARDRGIPPALPASALRFSCTLRVARFWFCSFPDGIDVRLPVLEELHLSHGIISESSLHALLAGCPVLQRLRLTYNDGCSSVRIASPTVRCIHVGRGSGDLCLQQLVVEDAPCLERLHHDRPIYYKKMMDILVISAPKLGILGRIYDHYPRFEILLVFIFIRMSSLFASSWCQLWTFGFFLTFIFTRLSLYLCFIIVSTFVFCAYLLSCYL